MRRRLIWTSICFVTMTALCFAQAGKLASATKPRTVHAGESKHAATQKELVNLEKRELGIIKNKDWKAFDPLLPETFVWVDDNGVILGRRETLQYISGFDVSDYSMADVTLTMISGDVGLLTYKLSLKGSFRGEALPSKPSYISSEYVRRGGRWFNVFNQSTLAK